MKKTYILWLAGLALTLIVILSLGFGYYLFCLNQKKDIYAVTKGCIEIIYTNKNETMTMKAIALSDDDGKSITPYAVTFRNVCQKEVKSELRLNISNKDNIKIETIKAYINGDIKQEPVLYSTLINSNSATSNANSKIIQTFTIAPKKTIRVNFRLWLDEKLGSSAIDQSAIEAKLELASELTTIKPYLKDVILEANGGLAAIEAKAMPEFNEPATINEGLIAITTNAQTSYHFRGSVDNNYLSFAGFNWRIVKLNEDGSIKIIYDDEKELITPFNNSEDLPDLVGYTYVSEDKLTDSAIKTALINFYNQNIKEQGLSKYLTEQNFCNDTSTTTKQQAIIFGGYERLYDAKIPQLNCPTTDQTYGGSYKTMIGLISADEVAVAGGVSRKANLKYYLKTKTSYFTMTPSDYTQKKAYIMIVTNQGELSDTVVSKSLALRPVINLKATTTVTGSGTNLDPYVIDLDS